MGNFVTSKYEEYGRCHLFGEENAGLDSTFENKIIVRPIVVTHLEILGSYGILTMCHMDKTLVRERDKHRLPISLYSRGIFF